MIYNSKLTIILTVMHSIIPIFTIFFILIQLSHHRALYFGRDYQCVKQASDSSCLKWNDTIQLSYYENFFYGCFSENVYIQT